MASEFILGRHSESMLSAIETCCQYVADMKRSMDTNFDTLTKKLNNINSSYSNLVEKVEALERFSDNVGDSQRHKCCEEVLLKLDAFESILQSLSSVNQANDLKCSEDSFSDVPTASCQSPIVLVRNNKPAQVSASLCLDSSVQVITLNSECDFPDGSWLGDESNPELRVRCPISPSNLLHVNTFCQTPEKMAVTLLDYLFPRDVLAISNLSGKGKHGKKQLDPLMIYGIRCHLVHKFNIDKKDWYRIKQNMDSKCRTAWRKKVKGLPLGRFKADASYGMTELQEIVSEDGQTIILAEGSCVDDSTEEVNTQVIHTTPADIKVLHATPEQLVRLQEAAHIQVLGEDYVLPLCLVEVYFDFEYRVICGIVDSVLSHPGNIQFNTLWVSNDSLVLRDYPQMLVENDDDDDDDDGQPGQVLTIGCPEQSYSICKSEMDFAAGDVDMGTPEFIEVQDITMTS